MATLLYTDSVFRKSSNGVQMRFSALINSNARQARANLIDSSSTALVFKFSKASYVCTYVRVYVRFNTIAERIYASVNSPNYSRVRNPIRLYTACPREFFREAVPVKRSSGLLTMLKNVRGSSENYDARILVERLSAVIG